MVLIQNKSENCYLCLWQNIQDPVGVRMLEAEEEGVCPNSRSREGTRGERATTRGTTLRVCSMMSI